MENFTIHIFGYGETQINSKDLSIKVPNDSLTTVTSLIAEIFAKKPADNPTVITDLHAISIFGYESFMWQSKKSFNFKNENELKPFIDALIAELQTAKDNQPIVVETPEAQV